MTMPAGPSITGSSRLMLPALVLAAIGGWFHNMREFPGTTVLASAMVVILLPTVVLGVWWMARPGPAARWAIIVWVLLNLLLGAALSVLPLPIWPWAPEQSAAHYTSHLVYGLIQIPLLIVAYRSQPTGTVTA